MPTAPDPFVTDTMDAFAHRTGLTSDAPPRRYLWTDAFAVCNYLTLHRRTGSERWLDLALQLVDQVHHVLGRHRDDDPRDGWISGLDDAEGARRPTCGGLRIGKELGERQPDEPDDPQGEWDRDGQYFHYLTKWMLALHRVGAVTGEPHYHRWAVELARAAHEGFVYTPAAGGTKRMYWKMSIDLTRPLVRSMGQHDPLDGLITCLELQAAEPEDALDAEIDDLVQICRGQPWTTDDPLGLGGLLTDALRTARLSTTLFPELGDLLQRLLQDTLLGLDAYAGTDPLQQPAAYRLAFRELGLSIGLHAAEHLRAHVAEHRDVFGGDVSAEMDALMDYAPLRDAVETFWMDDAHRAVESWTAHRDINAVMLATSLAPDAYLAAGPSGD